MAAGGDIAGKARGIADRFHSEHAARDDLARVERIAHWMDRRYVDPLLGLLLPGAGDVAGALIGLFAVASAFRLRAHPIVIARMLLNLAVDSVIGAIPVLGALFDLFYRAHTRNLRLLTERDVRAPRPGDWGVVGGAALLFVLALCLPVLAVIAALKLFF
jgi:uncharacterized protein DUF4112